MEVKGMHMWFLVLVLFWAGSTSYSYSAYQEWQSESLRDDIDDNFDIVFPERIDKGRSKRDLSTGLENGHDEEATIKLRAFGKDVVVEVHINKMVSSPQFTLRYYKEDGQVVQRKEAPPNCQYQGHLRGHEAQSTVILDTCHGLSGLIEDEDGRMYIAPYPAKGEGAHKIFKTRDGKWKMFSCERGSRPMYDPNRKALALLLCAPENSGKAPALIPVAMTVLLCSFL